MKKDLIVVIDTNIFISVLLSSKNCVKIRDKFAEGLFDIVISEEMLGELIDVIKYPKFQNIIKDEDVKELMELLKEDAIRVIPEEKVFICRDIKDNIVLECALAGRPDFIVCGDKDLLSLKEFNHIPIITPSEFVKFLACQ